MTEEFTISKWRKSMQRLCKLDEHPLPTEFAIPAVTKEMEAELNKMIAIVDAMTPEEISDNTLLDDETRRQRIAADAGVDIKLVASTIARYNEMAKAMASIGDPSRQNFVELPPNRRWAT